MIPDKVKKIGVNISVNVEKSVSVASRNGFPNYSFEGDVVAMDFLTIIFPDLGSH